MEEVASEPESQTSNFGVTRVSTQSLIVLYKKVCLISLISAVCRDLSCLLVTSLTGGFVFTLKFCTKIQGTTYSEFLTASNCL